MASLTLRRWPFKEGEEVELYWLCSPRQDNEKRWYIKAVFIDSHNQFKEVLYPFGSLPGLRIGQKYVDGNITEGKQKGTISEVKVPSSVQFEICKGFEIPKGLYAFYKNREYGTQLLSKFEISRRVYYIPCTEIVRSILAPSKFLCNGILRPNGLDKFIDSYGEKNQSLELNLTEEYPREFAKDTEVGYFTWLRFEKSAFYSWSSVYNNMLKKAAEYNSAYPANIFRRGIPIEAKPPMSGISTWTYRGISFNNQTLILELLYRSDLNIPYNFIAYNHPSMEKLESDDLPRGTKKAKGENEKTLNDEVQLDITGEPAKKQRNQAIVEQPPIMFSFKRNPIFMHIRKRRRTIHTGKPDSVITGNDDDDKNEQGNHEKKIVTTQDWELEGKIPPIEFKTMEMVKENPFKGLEDFAQVIQLLRKMKPSWDISVSVVYVPLGKSFSTYEDGYRRTCAIVKVGRAGHVPCYIIEVGRADGWSISTLTLSPISIINESDIEVLIIKLLNKLRDNSGHWDREFLKKQTDFQYDMLKHISKQSIYHWMDKLNKLI